MRNLGQIQGRLGMENKGQMMLGVGDLVGETVIVVLRKSLEGGATIGW